MMYYVYCLIDPRTERPFYVGKGSRYRPWDHFRETKKSTTNIRKYNRIHEIFDLGLKPKLSIFCNNLEENEAYGIEAELIRFYGRENIDEIGILTNICIDLRPPSRKGSHSSEKTKQILSARFKGKPLSEEHKAKIRASSLGKRMSQEARQKMGRPCSEEKKKKLSAALSGRKKPHSEAHKAAIRASWKIRKELETSVNSSQ